MQPLIVQRKGAGHNADFFQNTASAGFIRRILMSGGDAGCFVPASTVSIYHRELGSGLAPVCTSSLDIAVMSKLKSMTADDFSALPDVSEGLENRLFKTAHETATIRQFCDTVKTKRYTYARIRRIALSAFTGLEKCHQTHLPSYARVLALNRTGRLILSQLDTDASIITKPASARLSIPDSKLFDLESHCDELWALACPDAKAYNAMRRSPIYIDI